MKDSSLNRTIVTILCAGLGAVTAGCAAEEDDATTDAGGVACGEQVCAPNATCTITPTASTCTCPTGFEGDGVTCTVVPRLSATCADILAASPSANDGTHTLYVDGDATRPWDAWCDNMRANDGSAPREYLDVRNVTGGTSPDIPSNHSIYKEGNQKLVTVYDRVRVDPATMSIDIADTTFAHTHEAPATVVATQLPGVDVVESVLYGTAIACTDHASSEGITVGGGGNIDLYDTPFHLEVEQFQVCNALDATTFMLDPEKKRVDLQAASMPGGCGVVMPGHCTFPPVNGLAGDARWLKLHYDPPAGS